MLASQRHERILAELSVKGGVRITELVEALGVSEMTVRRDIEVLDRRGLLRRVHGGAIEMQTASQMAGIDVRPDVKARAMANVASRLIKPGMSVLIVNGSFAGTLAQRILELDYAETLHIYSTTVVAVKSLCEYAQMKQQAHASHAHIQIIGGVPTENIFTGPFATQVIRGLNIDIGFFQPTGLSPKGMSTDNVDRMETYRCALDSCRENVVLLENAVWGTDKHNQVAPLKQIDKVIIDGEPNIPLMRALTSADIRILKARSGRLSL